MNRIRAGRLTAWASLCALAALGLMGTAAQGAPAGPATAATTAASPPPIADFFRDPQVRRPKLSPDGRAVAMIVSNSESERSALAVIEPDQGNRITLVASFTDSDIAFFDWVGSDRLVYTSGKDEAGRRRDGNSAGLWTVKRDGSERRQLILTRYAQESRLESRIITRALPFEWFLYDVPDDDSGEVIVGYGIISIAAGEGHILNICIDPLEQGRGHGRRLLRSLVQVARMHHAERIFLEVRPSNPRAIALYFDEGFNEIGRRPRYYPAHMGREDAIVMAMELLD